MPAWAAVSVTSISAIATAITATLVATTTVRIVTPAATQSHTPTGFAARPNFPIDASNIAADMFETIVNSIHATFIGGVFCTVTVHFVTGIDTGGSSTKTHNNSPSISKFDYFQVWLSALQMRHA
ncbi:hypothetical protein DUT91_22820 [Phyllobacterium salinisoli]|uniref:Uncharacterized protein n=1 Tax=Phyllobacterium salinisoli TaxID=1899321 RepID=A0A368JWV3_9HYPH|nr:hypothetical protein [Phyllobacterium salinisoli]RCS21636.1 hypothetical protein DUT91_22820 [Phyllobacterium salinisoli]